MVNKDEKTKAYASYVRLITCLLCTETLVTPKKRVEKNLNGNVLRHPENKINK